MQDQNLELEVFGNLCITGKQYGLEVNSYIDERRDPFKSTEAACQYFVKLYDMFGDWNLVLAAYNGGPGYIQRKLIKYELKIPY